MSNSCGIELIFALSFAGAFSTGKSKMLFGKELIISLVQLHSLKPLTNGLEMSSPPLTNRELLEMCSPPLTNHEMLQMSSPPLTN